MKIAGGVLICWAASLLICELSVTLCEAAGKKKEEYDHCVNNTECESKKCCSYGFNGYCLESCETEEKTMRAGIPPKQCSSAKKAYRHFLQDVSWFHAMRLCCSQGNGARLADVLNRQDDNFMGNISRANAGKATWIGSTALLSSQKKNLQFVFVGTKLNVSYDKKEGFDNYDNGEHCVHVRTKKSSLIKTEYNDYPCHAKNYYVCYYPNESC